MDEKHRHGLAESSTWGLSGCNQDVGWATFWMELFSGVRSTLARWHSCWLNSAPRSHRTKEAALDIRSSLLQAVHLLAACSFQASRRISPSSWLRWSLLQQPVTWLSHHLFHIPLARSKSWLLKEKGLCTSVTHEGRGLALECVYVSTTFILDFFFWFFKLSKTLAIYLSIFS